ncbi:hypothetical protein [Maribacter luteus]|uniref:Uncharacterized protein n=1 Tax=Maribacter luteus TaxID=2594478 RepID=A0A6I2MMG4_9FLAO|nr:hypothetical protein [Maribacter luteus]MRX63690.1 hypothetical protein [Maribacter luteus]
MKKIALLVGFILIIFYFFHRYLIFSSPYIIELKDNDNLEIYQILDFDKDSLYISKERFITDIPLTDSNYSQFVHIRKGILRDSNNTIFFVKSDYNKKEKEVYRITDDYKYERSEISDLDKLTPLYYTEFPNASEFKPFYYKLNGYININPEATNPIILDCKKEFYPSYFLKNFWEIVCWSLNPADCSPNARKAKYIIKIQLKNQTLKLKSKGTSDYAYLNIYYKDNPKTDDFILIEYFNSLWIVKNK